VVDDIALLLYILKESIPMIAIKLLDVTVRREMIVDQHSGAAG